MGLGGGLPSCTFGRNPRVPNVHKSHFTSINSPPQEKTNETPPTMHGCLVVWAWVVLFCLGTFLKRSPRPRKPARPGSSAALPHKPSAPTAQICRSLPRPTTSSELSGHQAMGLPTCQIQQDAKWSQKIGGFPKTAVSAHPKEGSTFKTSGKENSCQDSGKFGVGSSGQILQPPLKWP